MTTHPTKLDRISFSSAGAVPPRAAARHAEMLTEDAALYAEIGSLLAHPPMFPPPVPAVSRADLEAAYDAACERVARDQVETDLIEARRLGDAIDHK